MRDLLLAIIEAIDDIIENFSDDSDDSNNEGGT